MVYWSLEYRDFLKRVLPDARDFYLIARREDESIAGALPTFISSPGQHGPLLNSLPFYGSHGGLILPVSSENAAVEHALVSAYIELETTYRVAASTLVESPLSPISAAARELLRPTHEDVRIGQITNLPDMGSRDEIESAILGACHQKTRNAIRKSFKSMPRIVRDETPDSVTWLFQEHDRGMRELNGLAKPRDVLQSLVDTFTGAGNCRIYRAYVGEAPAAALLLLYYGDTVEYFTPVATSEHRTSQVLSALIFHAMVEATVAGFRRWNWGGTWPSQDGVYRFKARWGAEDLQYRYHVRIASKDLLAVTPDQLRSRYPYFYAFPYSAATAAMVCNGR